MINYYKISILQLIVVIFFPILYFDWPPILSFDYPIVDGVYFIDTYDSSFYDISRKIFLPLETNQFYERALFPLIGKLIGATKSFETFELYRFLTYLFWAFLLCIFVNEKFDENQIYPNYTILFFIFTLPLTYFMFRQGHTKSDTTIIIAVTLIAFSEPNSIRRHMGFIILTLSHIYFAFIVFISVSIFEYSLYRNKEYLISIIKSLKILVLSYFFLTAFLAILGKGIKIPFIGPDEDNTLTQALVWRYSTIGQEAYSLSFYMSYLHWVFFIIILFILFIKNKILTLGFLFAFTFTFLVNLLVTWNEPRTFGICFFPVLIFSINFIYSSGSLHITKLRYFDYFFSIFTFLIIILSSKSFIF